MQRVFSADDLFEGNIDVTAPIFLDTTSWREFQNWSKQNHQKIKGLLEQGLVFCIFDAELKHTEPELYKRYAADKETPEEDEEVDEDEELPVSFEKELEINLGIKFHPQTLPAEDVSYKTFFYEVQTVYFHDVTNREKCDRHAEFIFLTRRAARSENKLRVMTAQPAFQRLVNAEIFLIPANSHKPTLPASFDVFTELQIHPRIRQVVEVDFRNGDYPKVVFQAVNVLRDFVREIINSAEDGGTLMNDALNLNYTGAGRNKQVSSLPPLLINKIAVNTSAEDSLVGEQEGFYRFAQGVFKAIRNPSAHATATDPFIQQRFNDENMAIKVLCFLSMLCERIDIGKRYSP